MTIKAWIASTLTVLACWIGLLMLIMVGSDAAPGAIVLFPPDNFIAHLPPEVALVEIGPYSVTVRSGSPKLGKTLYGAGAWIVLPAGLRGCVQLTKNVIPGIL